MQTLATLGIGILIGGFAVGSIIWEFAEEARKEAAKWKGLAETYHDKINPPGVPRVPREVEDLGGIPS